VGDAATVRGQVAASSMEAVAFQVGFDLLHSKEVVLRPVRRSLQQS
jgi:hypothetical protein